MIRFVSLTLLLTFNPILSAKDCLLPGQELKKGDRLTSANGKYWLNFQHDGNLVLYAYGYDMLWATYTLAPDQSTLLMQGDGNLVMYNTKGKDSFSSKTVGRKDCVLRLQDDGNLVIRERDKEPIWWTGTRDPALFIAERMTKLTDREFDEVCKECNTSVSVGTIVVGKTIPDRAARITAIAGLIAADSNCRKCFNEAIGRCAQGVRGGPEAHSTPAKQGGPKDSPCLPGAANCPSSQTCPKDPVARDPRTPSNGTCTKDNPTGK